MKEHIIYLAGLFDGEGTVTLTKPTRAAKWRYPTLTLTSTTRELVVFCQDNLGGNIVNKKIYQSHHKQAWQWMCSGTNAIAVCALLLPYIREPEKKYRMHLISTTYISVTPRNGKYSPDQIKLKEQFETMFFHPSNTLQLNG